MENFSVLIIAVLFKTLVACMACFGLWLVTRLLDKINGVSFKEVFDEADTANKVLYFSARVCAFGWLFANIFAYS